MRSQTFILMVVLSSTLNSFADSSGRFISDRYKLGCGFTQAIVDYISDEARAHNDQAELFLGQPVQPETGEAGRHVVLFSDQSYLILLELGAPREEVAESNALSVSNLVCVVAKGGGGSQEEGHIRRGLERARERKFGINDLPKEEIPLRPRSQIEKILSEPARRLGI